MKTRTKLGVFIICFVTIPIIIINIFISCKLSKQSQSIFENNVSQFAKSQSKSISVIFNEAVYRAKEVVSIDYIKTFTKYSNSLKTNNNSANKKNQTDNEILTATELDNIEKLNSGIECTMIINNNGIIAASSDSSLVGIIPDNYDYLAETALSNNGISAMSMYEINGKNIPVYYVVREIYSNDNQKQGLFVQLYNTIFLQKTLNPSKNYNSLNLVLIDSNGNILEHPFDKITSYKNTNDYKNIRDFIFTTTDDNKEKSSNLTSFTHNLELIYAYKFSITDVNWSLIFMASKEDVLSQLDSFSNPIIIFSIVLSLILITGIIGFVYEFTKPIDNIVNILTKKQRGDQSARFNANSNDEFGKIGIAFNSMFDDVFESEQRYRTIVEMTDNIVFEINFKKNNVFISNNFNQKFSFRAKSDNLQDSFFYKGRIHKDDKERFIEDFNKILGEANYMQGEYRFKNVYGDFAWVLIRATKFFGRDETPTKIVGVIVDIDREKKSAMHLLQRANYDALTQLYNRETFLKSLASNFELSNMRKSLTAILFIDIDDFKHFNDQYGHSCGDEVLKFVADTLKEISFEKGFAGRFGGDEFVICLNDQKYFGDPGKVAQDIICAIGKGFVSESTDQKLSVNCSIGIAFLNENGKSCEEVLNAADEAMYSIKKHGKSNYGYASQRNSNETINE